MRAWRDICVVAAHELGEALRSRRVLVFALLYLGGAVAGTLIATELLASIEAGLAEGLAVAAADKPGAMTRELMRTPEFQRMLTRAVRDPELARELSVLPPLSLFYGWLALFFSPVLVVLTATETITAELSTGAARFSLVRTDRLSWSVGKLAGQVGLMMLSVLFGALGVWVTGWWRLDVFDGAATAWWLVRFSTRVWTYAFAYVGLALGLSQLTRSVPVARALGLGALALTSAVWGVSQSDWMQSHAPVLGESVALLSPRAHMLDMWRTTFLQRAPAVTMLIALGLAFFGIGYQFRARRDA